MYIYIDIIYQSRETYRNYMVYPLNLPKKHDSFSAPATPRMVSAPGTFGEILRTRSSALTVTWDRHKQLVVTVLNQGNHGFLAGHFWPWQTHQKKRFILNTSSGPSFCHV